MVYFYCLIFFQGTLEICNKSVDINIFNPQLKKILGYNLPPFLLHLDFFHTTNKNLWYKKKYETCACGGAKTTNGKFGPVDLSKNEIGFVFLNEW